PCETALTSNVDADRRADRLRAAVGALECARPARLGLAVGVPPRGVPCRRPQVLDRAAMVACLFEMERELGGPLPRPGAEHVLLVPPDPLVEPSSARQRDALPPDERIERMGETEARGRAVRVASRVREK